MMRAFAIFGTLTTALLLASVLVIDNAGRAGSEQDRVPLSSVAAFGHITDDSARAAALFVEAGKVIQHPRCLNCHPAGDRPLQREEMRIHQQNVVRGPDGLGAIGMRCTACHRQENFEPGGVPGHPLWHLAPIEMAWVGKSLAEICAQIKDPARNGGKTIEEIVEHMANDSLVGWGWHPGSDREPVPGTQKEFGALFEAWAKAGAACPGDS